MDHSFRRLALIGTALVLAAASPAQARNAVIENALQSRPDLSQFYQGMVSTGVIDELREGTPYTVFAPTNEAFSRISASQYPCFYSAECKAQAAAVMRHHIVAGEKHLRDIEPRQADAMSLFSIDNRHIVASEPYKGQFKVDGKNVLSENQLAGGVLYRLNGVLVTNNELAQFAAPTVVMVKTPGTDLPPRVPDGSVVTVTTPANPAVVPAPATVAPAR